MREFKFKIGQVVQPILAPAMKLMVLERSYSECPGGSQIQYQCEVSLEDQYGHRYIIGDTKKNPTS